jgi:hypothetical protein
MQPKTRLTLLGLGIIASIGLTYRTAYIIDCRLGGGGIIPCWTQGPLTVNVDDTLRLINAIRIDDVLKLIAALGAVGAGTYIKGYHTYNPNLHDPRKRDESSTPPSV